MTIKIKMTRYGWNSLPKSMKRTEGRRKYIITSSLSGKREKFLVSIRR